jgi:hypothetical protein
MRSAYAKQLTCLLPMLFACALAHSAPLVYACADAGADQRLMDGSTAGWPNCASASYAASSKSLVVATLKGNPGVTRWQLASKVDDTFTIWGKDDTGAMKWMHLSAFTWDATTTTPDPPDGPLVKVAPATITFTWDAPTENKDGSPLTDLAGYRLYSHVDGTPFGELIQIANPSASSYVLNAVAAGNIFYAMTAYNKAGTESEMSGSVNVLVNPAPPAKVDCAVSAFGAWTDTGTWSACAAGTQSKTQQRARTVTTPASNGGAACPALTETQTVSQACTVAVKWVVAGTGQKVVYELIRNWNDSGWAQGGIIGYILGGKPCDVASVWSSNNWHKVSESDYTSIISITYKGRQGIVQCAAK